MSEPLISATNVWKKYSRSLSKSLSYGLRDSVAELFNRRQGGKLREKEFWVLRDINFELRRGEALGVIGRNGAGKTTLLRVVSGLLKPDRGEVRLRGQVERVMDLSAGFKPMLTGRENLKLRAQLRGMGGVETAKFVEQAIEFAELDEFIDSPIQYYSSGMRARLSFAASITTAPDVVIIDEVLAVGDLGFRLKCYEYLNAMVENAAVVFVSHSMGQVSRLCTAGCVLEKGQVKHLGDIQTAIRLYNETFDQEVAPNNRLSLNPELLPTHLEVGGSPVTNGQSVQLGTPLSVVMDTSRLPADSSFRVIVRDAGGAGILDCNSIRSKINGNGGALLACDLGPMELSPGRYFVVVIAMAGNGRDILCFTTPIEFRVEGQFLSAIPVQKVGAWMRLDGSAER